MVKLGELRAIWRYPIKSLAADRLESTRVEPEGVPGDRAYALEVTGGHARAGKPYRGKEHNLLHTTHDLARAVQMAAQRGVTVAPVHEPHNRFFDDAPISLIFDRWIAQVEDALHIPLDPRRWRPNFYARATNDFAFTEPDLVDRTIEIGEVLLRVRDTIKRCVTPTYDIATGESNGDVLAYVAQQRGNVMGVYCEVELAGTVREGADLLLRAR